MRSLSPWIQYRGPRSFYPPPFSLSFLDCRTAYYRTPLHLACIGIASCGETGGENIEEVGETKDAEEDVQMIQLLLENGADIEAKDAEGCTALHRAAENGRTKCLWKLISSGCDIYSQTPKRWNSLHYAAFGGKIDACRLLTQRDAENGRLKAARDSMRCTPSEVAKDEKTRHSMRTIWESAESGNMDSLVKCIGNAGIGSGTHKPWKPAGLEDATFESGFKVIHSAILGHEKRLRKGFNEKSSSDKTVQIVCLLLDKHCYVNCMDKVCRTPLHFAARYGLVGLIDVLVSRGANIDAEDVLGSTPLSYAYAFRKMKVVSVLTKLGAVDDERNKIPRMRHEEQDDGEDDDDEGSYSEDDYSSDDYSSEDSSQRKAHKKNKKKKKKSKKRRGKRLKGRLPR